MEKNISIREKQEKREHELFSPYASFSDASRGRDRVEEPCDLRPVYQRDRDRILHCKAFRRLKGKTQVFLAPEGDHYRTRLTHTLEVAQNARTIARALRLNEDLTEAVALGHDLGHTPFGHAGERALNRVCPGGFDHCAQSIRVVEHLEKNGRGLNLTFEVRDGIKNHQTAGMPATLEGNAAEVLEYPAANAACCIFPPFFTYSFANRSCLRVIRSPPHICHADKKSRLPLNKFSISHSPCLSSTASVPNSM